VAVVASGKCSLGLSVFRMLGAQPQGYCAGFAARARGRQCKRSDSMSCFLDPVGPVNAAAERLDGRSRPRPAFRSPVLPASVNLVTLGHWSLYRGTPWDTHRIRSEQLAANPVLYLHEGCTQCSHCGFFRPCGARRCYGLPGENRYWTSCQIDIAARVAQYDQLGRLFRSLWDLER